MTLTESEGHGSAAANGAAAPSAPPPMPNGADGDAPPPKAARRTAPYGGYPLETIEQVRRLVVETSKPLTEIARETGVSASTIKVWTRRYGWTRPADAPPLYAHGAAFDPAGRQTQIALRLYRALGRQLTGLEKRAKRAGGETAEKDARTLGVLAKTLETLIELDRADGAKVKEPEPADRGHLRLELARKIAAWAEEEQEPAQPDRRPGQ